MVTDRVIFVCTIIIAAIYLYATTLIPSLEIGDPLGPKAFPRLLGIALLIAAGLLFLEMLKARKQKPAADAAPVDELAPWRYAGMIAIITVWTGLYYATFEIAGYVVATAIYLLALMAWFNRGKWLANVLTAVLFSILSFLMFVKLDVNLPHGGEGIAWLSGGIIKAVDAVIGIF